MRFFIVTAKCGHVGKGRYIDVDFPVVSENGSEAARNILKRTKVKKQLKNAITSVVEIKEDEYYEFIKKNPFKSYLSAHSSREFDLNDYNVKTLTTSESPRKQEFSSRKERVKYILKKYKINLKYEMVGY